ncbi:MAG: hypothetical protein GY750_15505 [Lentisphaerae bacterium]|nr:hypothetical protein [Lentisphaerota bacterium]MCP4102804.1 hypothetical protein [Lentisphaerota bacterium]
MIKKLILAVTISTCAAVLVKAADRPKLAVLPFTTQSGKIFNIEANNKNIKISTKVEVRDLSDQLINFLVSSRKFDVLERDYIRRLIEENKLTESDWAKPGQEKRIGKLLVADYLVVGTVDRLEYLVRQEHLKITGENLIRVVAKIKVQYRIIEIKSGKIVFSGQEENKLTSDDVRAKVPRKDRRDWTFMDFRNYLFNTTVNSIGNAILDSIFPLKVVTMTNNGNNIVLNRGLGAGMKKGQIYEVFKLGGDLIDPDTKEFLGRQEKQIGKIVIISVAPRFSKAKALKPSTEFKPGYICRPAEKNSPKPKTADYPKATAGW